MAERCDAYTSCLLCLNTAQGLGLDCLHGGAVQCIKHWRLALSHHCTRSVYQICKVCRKYVSHTLKIDFVIVSSPNISMAVIGHTGMNLGLKIFRIKQSFKVDLIFYFFGILSINFIHAFHKVNDSVREKLEFKLNLPISHFGIHWIVIAEYSQMSTHLPRFQSFSRFFASFCIGQISLLIWEYLTRAIQWIPTWQIIWFSKTVAT